jgi:hypothetical protein
MRKLAGRVYRSFNRALSRAGWTLEPLPKKNASMQQGVPYLERPEMGPINWKCKEERLQRGENFEWPNIIALNHTVASLLGEAKNIVELGSGTGAFALEASKDNTRKLLCAEVDSGAYNWAKENRARPNIEYVNRFATPADGPFDVVVSIEVIEHIMDFNGFLATCQRMAPRALITTPNRTRNRHANSAGPPPYEQHVREWSAGEFYWVLRCYWDEVKLYGMPDEYTCGCIPITVVDATSPLIADCRYPRVSGGG